MITIKPFKALRPNPNCIQDVADLPYDVVTDEEVRERLKVNPYSFLAIDKPEAVFVPGICEDSYHLGAKILKSQIQQGIFQEENEESFYIYGLERDNQKQYGIVGCFKCNDYWEGSIKKHEKTRQDKEEDRIKHVSICQAHTGPIFLAYKKSFRLEQLVDAIKLHNKPLYDFVDKDGVKQVVYRVNSEVDIDSIQQAFAEINALYIADGHHRAAAACQYAKDKGEQEESNFFLGVAFPKDELSIMAYNRIVACDDRIDENSLMNGLSHAFTIQKLGEQCFQPQKRHCFGVGYKGVWYQLQLKEGYVDENNPVESLDVAILQRLILEPIFKIKDPRIDKRLTFVGGTKGLEALSKAVQEEGKVAFSLYPTSIDELLSVADEGKLMPPKSTWFEPKLRSGIFIHNIAK